MTVIQGIFFFTKANSLNERVQISLSRRTVCNFCLLSELIEVRGEESLTLRKEPFVDKTKRIKKL